MSSAAYHSENKVQGGNRTTPRLRSCQSIPLTTLSPPRAPERRMLLVLFQPALQACSKEMFSSMGGGSLNSIRILVGSIEVSYCRTPWGSSAHGVCPNLQLSTRHYILKPTKVHSMIPRKAQIPPFLQPLKPFWIGWVILTLRMV